MIGHGYKITGLGIKEHAYHVGALPGRKRPALYRIDSDGITPAAYFRDDNEAEKFLKFLDLMHLAREINQ